MSIDLSQVGGGFSDPVFGSQAVFRRSLEALANPGTIASVAADADVPAGVHPAASALLLALLDQDTRLWVSPALAGTGAPMFLRFHTGCSLVDDPACADFALAGCEDLPPLQVFAAGSDDYPDRSATLVVQSASLRDDTGWTLTGPGIRGRGPFLAAGLGDNFLAQWAANRKLFPRGVDLFVTCGSRLAGLPRTTRIES